MPKALVTDCICTIKPRFCSTLLFIMHGCVYMCLIILLSGLLMVKDGVEFETKSKLHMFTRIVILSLTSREKKEMKRAVSAQVPT
jgi:hypothetical protein